ncbi:hypothetical protein MMC10_003914 [Thelotrema lepadinum]|nr:hypothetical protein [Thelotrema lepadinum]
MSSLNQGHQAFVDKPSHSLEAPYTVSDKSPKCQATNPTRSSWVKAWAWLDSYVEDGDESTTSSGPEAIRNQESTGGELRRVGPSWRSKDIGDGESDSIDEHEDEATQVDQNQSKRKRNNGDDADSFRIVKKARSQRAKYNVTKGEVSKLLDFITKNISWEDAGRYVFQEISASRGQNDRRRKAATRQTKMTRGHAHQTIMATETASRLSTHWKGVLCKKMLK